MRPGRTRWRFRLLTLVVSLLLAFAAAEGVARLIEPRGEIEGWSAQVADPVVGWLPPPGRAVHRTAEFTAVYDVNDSGMNDEEIRKPVTGQRVRIVAVGDSHTFALGVSREEAWPHRLEQMLFAGDPGAGTVYNLAVAGHGLPQYLLRMEQTLEELRPQVVVVGFSMATDLWDLIPPRKGGFVYGKRYGRVYFDLDDAGRLLERHDLEGQLLDRTGHGMGLRLRNRLQHLGLYRLLKHSRLAFWVALHVRPGGRSLWAGMDTALCREPVGDDAYRWQLAEALLRRLVERARAAGAVVLVVDIPYIAQVYDEVWEDSFAGRPETYDRWVAGKRLAAICRRVGAEYVDTLPPMVEWTRTTGRWLHHARDAHPTAEGHELIAETVHRALDGISP